MSNNTRPAKNYKNCHPQAKPYLPYTCKNKTDSKHVNPNDRHKCGDLTIRVEAVDGPVCAKGGFTVSQGGRPAKTFCNGMTDATTNGQMQQGHNHNHNHCQPCSIFTMPVRT